MMLHLAALMLVLARPAAGIETGPEAVIRFHRVMVPAGRMKDWPTGGGKYLPMDVAGFERLVEAAQPRAAKTPAPPPAAIAAARYEGRLVGERLVGTAALDVALVGAAPALLPFEPCNLSIRGPAAPVRELATPVRGLAASAASEAALGLAADGTLRLRIEHSGRLNLEWSLAGRRESDDALGFSLELPPVAANQLSLDLPNGLVPTVDRGIILGSEPAAAACRRWRIELGGNHGCRLHLAAEGLPAPRRLLALLRESRTYDCSPRGLEVSLQWRLQVHNQPLRQVTLLVDPGLQLVSARLGENEIPWSSHKLDLSPLSVPARVVLTLPEPIRDGERVIRLGAIGPVVLDRPWRLPRIRCQALSWQEGAVTLLVSEPLLANRIAPQSCAQTDAGPLGSPRKGQSAQFQCFDPDATVELSLGCAPVKFPSPDAATEKTPRDCAGGEEMPPPPAAGRGVAAVLDCRLQSWYQAEGAVRHVAEYELQGCQGRRLELAMPPGVVREDLRSVRVDGDTAAWRWTETDGKRRISVLLPAGRGHSCVAVEWTAAGPRWGIFSSLAAVLPAPDLPMAPAPYWTVYPPPGYQRLAPSDDSGNGGGLSWSQRLFGPLGRAAGARRFNPFSAEQWLAVFGGPHATEPTTATWQMDLAADSPARMTFVHRPTMQLLGSVVMLLTVAVGCWRARRRPAHLMACLGVFAAAAMVLPEGCVPLATGGVLGTLFCLLWQWIRPPFREAHPLQRVGLREGNEPVGPRRNPDSTVSMTWPLGLMLLGLLAPLAVCSAARGTAPSRDIAGPSKTFPSLFGRGAGGEGRPDYPVLVPIDAQRKPVGGTLFVPEPLYQELHRRLAAAERPPAWMIVGATYRGELVREAASGRLMPGTLRAEYELWVFEQAARVQLPLDAAAAGLLPGSLRLDGQPVGSDNGDGSDFGAKSVMSPLWFVVAEPGRHRLELSLRPVISGGAAAGGFDLGVPRVPAARLELTLPDEAPLLEVPSARGTVEITPARSASEGNGSMPAARAGGRLVAELGPADHLTVRWRKPTAAGGTHAPEAQQLLWLRVQPGSVVIAAKFKLRAADGGVDRVQLAVDPRLRLLPLGGDDLPAAEIGAETGPSRPVTFRWPRPIAGETALEATFLLSGASGVGNLCLPQIDLLDARVTGRWLAVSVDPALDHQERQRQGLAAVPIADFLTAWNAAGTLRPQAAYRLPAGPVAWTLSTRPHEPHCAIDQTLSLSFDADHADLDFDGRLSVTAGYVFQHRLTAPRELKIERVSVLEGDAERALRWVQDDDGVITVFLSGPASGLQKLSIRGQLPVGMGEKWPLPAMRVEKCELHSATIRLFRRPGVQLTFDGPPRGRPPEPPGDSTDSDLGRLVATIPWAGSSQPPVTVTVKPDRSEEGRARARTRGSASTASEGLPADAQSRTLPAGDVPRLAAAALFLLAALACLAGRVFQLVPGDGRVGELVLRLHSAAGLGPVPNLRLYAAGVLLGLAWWLWLSPSVLGLLIVVASVLGAGRGRAT